MEQEHGLAFLVPPPPAGQQPLEEEIIEAPFPEPVALQAAERAQAQAQFTRLLDKYRQELPYPGNNDKYNVALLVQLFHDHAPLQVDKDNILRHFLGHVASVPKAQQDNFDLILSGLAGPENPDDTHCSRIKEFADSLVSSLIVPLRALGGKTPVLSPIFSPEAGIARVGTGKRPPSLQDKVAMRDRHRCAISGAFSEAEWEARSEVDGLNAADDDGVLFTHFNPLDLAPMDTAHIIPHSIGARVGESNQLVSNQAQLTALNTLHMFDSNVCAEIEGIAIDWPTNALLLTKHMHDRFGQFKVYFDQQDEPNTYIVRVTRPNMPIAGLPRTVRFESEVIPLPSPRLLAVHKALARIMHLTAAGEKITRLFRDSPDTDIAADGTTDLGALLTVGFFTKLTNPPIYAC
ncbi:MAG: hypothetical protein M1829_002033 [Trizodia sp. TS-e1964]|nr:MAG: hypothetical protein M1829_002033 [Trizodia sp. TS-e1964]